MFRGLRWTWLVLALFVFVLPSSAQDEKKDTKKTDAKSKDTKKKGDDSDDDTKDTKKKKGDDSKDSKDSKDTKKKDDPNKMIQVGRAVEGTLVNTDNGKVKVRTKRPVFNPGSKKYEARDVELEFELGDKVSVRLEALPVAFDDKGRKKQYSKDELAELKGPDKTAFGYTGTMDQLKPQQYVRVFMGKPKSAAKADPPRVFMIHIAGNGGN
jgi:hypothetical protein